jgi:hypothetical protein
LPIYGGANGNEVLAVYDLDAVLDRKLHLGAMDFLVVPTIIFGCCLSW